VSAFTDTVAASNATVISELADLPQVDAVRRTVPGFFPRTTPVESTVATVVSDDANLIGTSVRVPPSLFVAFAVSRS
jgi:hypothetical protein